VPEPTISFVPLKFVLAALENLAGLSATSALLVVMRLCADDSDAYFHDGEEDPHPDFWRFPEEIKADGSDLIPTWDISLPPLRNVICWEDVAAAYPQIGDPPPQWREPPSEPTEKASLPAKKKKKVGRPSEWDFLALAACWEEEERTFETVEALELACQAQVLRTKRTPRGAGPNMPLVRGAIAELGFDRFVKRPDANKQA
jgi:hypothetical protein